MLQVWRSIRTAILIDESNYGLNPNPNPLITNPVPNPVSSTARHAAKQSTIALFDDLMGIVEDPENVGIEGIAIIERQIDSEIYLYKGLSSLPMFSDIDKTHYNNPLLWWKATALKFPLLSRRAQKVLAIQATSAPSERVFSSGGNVVTKNRASNCYAIGASE